VADWAAPIDLRSGPLGRAEERHANLSIPLRAMRKDLRAY
jgi:hypothetical protein